MSLLTLLSNEQDKTYTKLQETKEILFITHYIYSYAFTRVYSYRRRKGYKHTRLKKLNNKNNYAK